MRIAAGMIVATLLTSAIPAAGQEALLGISGAWALESEDCGKLFRSEKGRMVFASTDTGPLPAFIIDSASISNNEYLCTVKEYRVRLADVTFTGRCDFGRRTKRQKFTMRELNGQFKIEIGRQFVPIKRCTPADFKGS